FSIQPRVAGTRAFGPVLLYATMGILPITAVLLFYSTIPGGLHAFYLATIRFNLDVYTSFHGPFDGWNFILWGGYLLPFAIVGWMEWRRQQHRREGILSRMTGQEKMLYVALAGSFLAIGLIQQKYPLYHFAPFYMLLCPVAAAGVEWSLQRVRRWPVRIASILILGSPYFVLRGGERREVFEFAHGLLTGGNPFEMAYAGHWLSPMSGAGPERAVIHYLSQPGNDTGAVEIC